MGKWKKVNLSQIVELIHGYQFRDEDFVVSGIPVIKITNVINGSLQLKDLTYVSEKRLKEFENIIIKNGDILMSLTGNIGRVVEVSGLFAPVFQNYRVGKFEPKNDVVSKSFLKHLLSQEILFLQLTQFANQSAQANFGKQDLNKLFVDYPEDKTEQANIASIISKADEAIEQTEALIAKYQRIKTGLMQDLLTRGIDEQGNIRNEKTHRFKTENGLKVPEEWEVLTLEEICSKITDGSHFSPVPQQDGRLIGNVKDMGEYEINLTTCTRITEKDFNILKQQNCCPQKGDVLLSKDGTIGRVIFYYSEFEIALLSSIAILRPITKYNGILLTWLLKSEFFKKQLLVLESGSALRRIILKDIKKLKFPFPKRKDEQGLISTKLSKMSDLIFSEECKLHKLQYLKTGLMQDLLSGKVRVNIKTEKLVNP